MLSDTAKLFTVSVTACLILALSGAAFMQFATAAVGAPLLVPYTIHPPDTDGVCKNDEWKGASITRMVPYKGTIYDKFFLNNTEAYLMLKHDDRYLYACLDWVSQKDIHGSFQIWLDTLHNGQPRGYSGPDDLNFGIRITNVEQNNINFERFSFANTPTDKMLAGVSFSPSPNNPASISLQYEVAIPMEQIKQYPNPSNPDLVGLLAVALGKNYESGGIIYPAQEWSARSKEPIYSTDTTFLPYIQTTTTTKATTSRTSVPSFTTLPMLGNPVSNINPGLLNGFAVVGIIVAIAISLTAVWRRRNKGHD